jgi:zinc/manganese transport system permease protein
MEAWQILLPAFVMSALMIVTHTYLGLHVLARGIIFVDLALAQISALGVSVAFLLGKEAHGHEAQIYAFIATLVAALAFTGLHRIPDKTAREVTIGIVYIVATALSLVILSRTSQGMEELKSLFNGNILWVRWEELTIVAIAYALLVLLHTLKRKQFYALSFNKENNNQPSLLWEFLFFASFAVVITLAVNIAGILLVFAFLIIPGFSASILMGKFGKRLLLGWLLGLTGSAIGLWVAFVADLPVGATVVSLLGLLPIVALLIKQLMKKFNT